MPIPVNLTDKDLGFCFAAFYSGRSEDAYIEFEKFKGIPAFQDYLTTISQEERTLLARYIAWCVDRSRYSLEKVVNLIITNEQEKEEVMQSVMQSVAQEYMEKGIEQGIEQGIELATVRVAKNLFKLNLDLDTVQKATGLTKEDLQRIIKK